MPPGKRYYKNKQAQEAGRRVVLVVVCVVYVEKYEL
jgi:hypothetical protein